VTASLDYGTFVNTENMKEAQKEGLKEIERMCNTRSWKENAEECVLRVVEMNSISSPTYTGTIESTNGANEDE
jgi:hypothetical protein